MPNSNTSNGSSSAGFNKESPRELKEFLRHPPTFHGTVRPVKWDYVIVGSGFGGSACSLRLTEKGYRVLLLEKGQRLRGNDFPKTNWDLRRWFWLPALGFRGLFKMTFLRHITAMSGVGVGGGSLVYANTMPMPPDEAFEKGSWTSLAHWKAELAPHFITAKRMMGVTTNPYKTKSDELLAEVAKDLGRAEHVGPAQVAVHFGKPALTVSDPYFDGAGPTRTGCIQCGACMTGCRHNAKNTLDKNYLYLAEKLGLQIDANTEVHSIRPLSSEEGYEIIARQRLPWGRRRKRTFLCKNVILAGGVLGTVELLSRMKESPEHLPALSANLGRQVRTNSEVLLGVTSRGEHDLSKGIAIGSIFHTDAYSHVEPVRYGSGSGFFRLMGMPHAPGKGTLLRLLNAFAASLRQPLNTLRWLFVRNWAKHTTILLYMRSLEGTLSLRLGRSFRNAFRKGLVSELSEGPHPTASIPEASDIGERFAKKLDGYASSMITEVVLDIPTTAHLLGGCPMGESTDTGVIDHRHRVFGYRGLYVIDGSAISGNLGVNPSLTILAMSERAMSFIEPAPNTAS